MTLLIESDAIVIPNDALLGTFGWKEFEDIALNILKFLSKTGDEDEELDHWGIHCTLPEHHGYKRKSGWKKIFFTEEVTDGKEGSIRLFTMFAASGWLGNAWWPRGAFYVSDEFKERILSRWANKV